MIVHCTSLRTKKLPHGIGTSGISYCKEVQTMDNYTMLQSAARRQSEGARSGFASLSRVDQADKWAAWQASAPAADTYPHMDIPAREPDPQPQPAPPPPPKRSFALYNGIVARHRQVFGPER